MDKLALGRRINTARKERGITGEKLSELCNINATYLRQIESGSKTPSLPMFVTICQQLRVSPQYLLADDLASVTSTGFDDLVHLLDIATPRQAELITGMIRCATSIVEEQNFHPSSFTNAV